MKILITGSGGFVGKNLINALKNDCNELYALVSNPANTHDLLPLKNIFTYDKPEIIKQSNFDVIIHLAGKAHDLKKVADPDEYYAVNYELTRQLYDEFLASTATRFIFVSSVKAAADVVEGVLTEQHVPNPQTHYGKSKLMAEQYIQNCATPEGKSYYILRPCMIHGPGNKGNLNLLYKFVQNGVPYPLAAFDNRRSFLSVSNLNFIIENLATGPVIPNGVYNVADDEPLSTTQLVSTIATISGLKARLWKINTFVIQTLASVGDKLHLPLNTERLTKLTENYVVSNQKIKNALRLTKLPLTSQQGLEITVQSFKSA